MALEYDYMGERLARIRALLDEANRTKAKIAPTDRALRRQLVVQLDQMLKELGQRDSPPSRNRASQP
jgi:hypothetical protein